MTCYLISLVFSFVQVVLLPAQTISIEDIWNDTNRNWTNTAAYIHGSLTTYHGWFGKTYNGGNSNTWFRNFSCVHNSTVTVNFTCNYGCGVEDSDVVRDYCGMYFNDPTHSTYAINISYDEGENIDLTNDETKLLNCTQYHNQQLLSATAATFTHIDLYFLPDQQFEVAFATYVTGDTLDLEYLGISFISIKCNQIPTENQLQPTSNPTTFPTIIPYVVPRQYPSNQPTTQPSFQPSNQPTTQPSFQPSSQPTTQPSFQPSNQPTTNPSNQPSNPPTTQPSFQPSNQPTTQPSNPPTTQPSYQPSFQPSNQPSNQPTTQTSFKTTNPSSYPSKYPSVYPSNMPTTASTVDGNSIALGGKTVNVDALTLGLIIGFSVLGLFVILAVIFIVCYLRSKRKEKHTSFTAVESRTITMAVAELPNDTIDTCLAYDGQEDEEKAMELQFVQPKGNDFEARNIISNEDAIIIGSNETAGGVGWNEEFQ